MSKIPVILKKEADSGKNISLLQLINQEKISLDTIKNIINHLTEKYNLDPEDIVSVLSDEIKYASIPVSIFSEELSPLETVVKFIKENYGQSIGEIALLLKRDYSTIFLTYRHAARKKREFFKLENTPYLIPLSILNERPLSVLELISEFLKDNYHLNYHEIAVLLKRDERTIWTVYQRAKKKRISMQK